MVIVPAEKQKAGIRKLAWNHFGPYKITEITESSAFVVPVDKLERTPFKVPLERLIHVPPGIPDISILPEKKNPFRHLLKAMGVFEEGSRANLDSFGSDQTIGVKNGAENRKMLVVYSLRATNFSGGGAVEVENRTETCRLGDGTFQWLSDCSGTGHDNCSHMRVSDFDPVIDRASELGTTVVTNPIKALLTAFVLRRLNSNTAARQLVSSIITADAGQEWIAFCGHRGNLIPSTVLPDIADLRDSLEARFLKCRVASQALATSAFQPLALDPPEMPFQGEEREAWLKVFRQAAWTIEEVRAKFIHRLPLLEYPRAIIGDSTAQQLYTEMTETALISSVEDGLAGIVRQFAGLILSSKVRAVLLVMGPGEGAVSALSPCKNRLGNTAVCAHASGGL
uniref:Uncharacterized protein n=1 Tax=Globodera rostochiensis TaxID=31243 RepID=A0A914HG58_GLORO